MSIYRVNSIGGSDGFKVNVARSSGGLRVVGIFWTEADANAWIAADSCMAERSEDVSGLVLCPDLRSGQDLPSRHDLHSPQE
jgi:hypothetical protein